MTSANSPTVRRRRLASELRRLREAAKLTCEEVAELMECSASKISRVETGRVSVSPRDVRDMLEIYGASPDQSKSLVQLARDSRQKGWWHAYGDTVQPHLATYLGMESAASEIRIYKVSRIPSMLQTEEYSRAILAAGNAGSRQNELDRHVALMMERQRLAKANPQKVWFVLDEAALRRQVGGPEVMRVQIEYMREVAYLPNVFLQFIPFSGGAHVAMDLPFVVLSFPDPVDPDVVCLGYPTGALWIEDMAEVDRYNLFFHHLQAAALSFDDSMTLMTSVLKEM
ncbi:MAG TPA: helix-turn-helix transcriptional regulator [Streptosporangiaceae bacterium]|nr:helix-turn-helix transcriptional regulator [Streptosporangiaceae bacterium]